MHQFICFCRISNVINIKYKNMKLDKKIIAINFIAICAVISIIVFVVNKNQNNQQSSIVDNPYTNISSNSETTNNSKNTDQNVITTDNTKAKTELTISDKCRGCGKCARIDSEHFSIQGHGSKATVISSNNLNSTNLQTAIAMCPAEAISLN